VANINAHIYAREEQISAIRMIVLKQWFPKRAVPSPWGRWETLGGRWSRNVRLGVVKQKWEV